MLMSRMVPRRPRLPPCFSTNRAGANSSPRPDGLASVRNHLASSPRGGSLSWSLCSAMDQFVRRQRRIADLVRQLGASTTLIPPKVLEPVGRHFGVSDRVLDVL